MLTACADIETFTSTPAIPERTCSISAEWRCPAGLYGLTTLYLSEKWVESEGFPPAPEEPIFASTTMCSASMGNELCFRRGARARMEVMAMHPGAETRVAHLTSSRFICGMVTTNLPKTMRPGSCYTY